MQVMTDHSDCDVAHVGQESDEPKSWLDDVDGYGKSLWNRPGDVGEKMNENSPSNFSNNVLPF